MSDIFISYAREDRDTAQRLAEALEAEGWSVWWDARLNGGEVWRQVIARQLRAARCVIVLWSQASVENDWVLAEAEYGRRAEAEYGRQRRILFPIKIENVEPPLPFGEIQTVDLIDWNGHSQHPGFIRLVASLPRLPEGPPPPPPPIKKWKRVVATTIFLLIAMPATLLFLGWNQPLRNFWSLTALAWQSDLAIPPAVDSPLNRSLKFNGSRKTDNPDLDLARRLEADASERFAIDTGTKIESYNPTQDEPRLAKLRDVFNLQSNEFDAVLIDIVWAGELAPHLVNLRPFLKQEIESYGQIIINNNTVEDRTIALPWFQNVGLLFYRDDLLRGSGLAVPDTWKELEEVAATIQARQSQNDREFIGFAWQGEEYEGLTCNALEWIASEGALDADTDLPDFDHPGVLDALDRARRWVNGENAISPYARRHKEEASLQTFVNGKAAFYRGWSNEYAVISREFEKRRQDEHSMSFQVRPLPRGRVDKKFSALGGWQLAVPKYSLNQRSAIDFIRYLGSREVQKWRAQEGTYQPTIKNLIEDADVQSTLPFLKNDLIGDIQLIIRPSKRLGDRYNGVSRCIYTSVHSALRRNSRDEVKQDIEKMKDCIETCAYARCF